MYNTMETHHLASEQCFASIEAQLASFGMNLEAFIVQSQQPYQVQHQAVPILEQGAAAAGLPPPSVPLPSRYIYNVTPSPLLQRQ